MSDNRGRDDSFILPGTTTQGKFNCAVCGSSELAIALDGAKMVVRLVCRTCGNFLAVRLTKVESAEVPDGSRRG